MVTKKRKWKLISLVVSPRMFSRQLHGRYYQFLYSISLLLTLWEPTPQMVKHTQTVCRQFADELFECVWPFCGVGAEKVKTKNKWLTVNLSVWQFEKRKTDLIFHNLVPRAVKKKNSGAAWFRGKSLLDLNRHL